MLDFDKQKFDPVVNRGNDIRVDVAPGRYPIIVAAPMNGASGIYLKTVNLGADFDLNSYYDDCNQNVSGFLKGGIPFDYQGDLFCWQTNEGFLADFVIEKLYGPYTNYIVEIKYLVWNQLLN